VNWELRTLGDLGEWGSGGTPLSSTPEYYNGTIPWLIIEDLNDGIVTTAQKKITELGLKNSSAKFVEPGTLLIAMYGSIGKLGIAGIRCATNQAIAFCRHNPELVDVNFLFYYLLFSREKLLDMGKGNTQQNIGQTVLKEYPIPLPPLTEQKRIASLLRRADRLRQLRRAAHDLGDALLQSVFLEMFGDIASNLKGWDIATLEDLETDFIYGTSQKCFSEPKGFPVLRIPNILHGTIDLDDLKYAEVPDKEAKNILLKHGDIIFVRTNGNPDYVGRCAVFNLDKNFLFASYLIRARLDLAKINPVFLLIFLQTSKGREAMSPYIRTTAGQSNIGIEGLGQIPVPLPPLSLQENFAGVVRRVEGLRGRMAEAGRQGEGLFESLLAEAFA
jgi:type I restriction enzyme S subunit